MPRSPLPAPDERARGAVLRRDLTRGIALAALAATGAIFFAVDARSHSVSDTFYGMVGPVTLVVAAALVASALVAVVLGRSR